MTASESTDMHEVGKAGGMAAEEALPKCPESGSISGWAAKVWQITERKYYG